MGCTTSVILFVFAKNKLVKSPEVQSRRILDKPSGHLSGPHGWPDSDNNNNPREQIDPGGPGGADHLDL